MATINYNDPWIQQKALQQWGPGYGTQEYITESRYTAPMGDRDTGDEYKVVVKNPEFEKYKQDAMDWVLFGEYGQQGDGKAQILAELDKQAQIAGLPDNFDWTSHLISGAQQHWSKYNQPFRYLESPMAGVVAPAMQSAAQVTPELAGMAEQFAPGSEYWNQSEAEQKARLAQHQSNESGVQNTFWSGLAALGAGAALSGAGASAGAAETGLSAELAAGAPELAGTMGLSAGTGAGALSAELAAGAPELAGTMGLSSGAGALGLESIMAAPPVTPPATTPPPIQTAAANTGGATITDVSPGLLDITGGAEAGLYEGGGLASELAMGAPEAAGALGSTAVEGTGGAGVLDSMYGQATGYGNLSQAELAQIIESGTAGSAGASLEGLAGIGSGGGLEGLISGTVGSNVGTTLANVGSTVLNQATGGAVGGTTAGGGSGGTGNYQFPWDNVIGGLIGQYFNNQNQKDLVSALNAATAAADPFAAQRPQYQQQFSQLTSSPSNFFADPAIRSVMDAGQETSARKLSAMGYNMSGNMAEELTKTGQREAFSQYMPYAQMIGGAAGANLSQGGVGQTAATAATAAHTAQSQQNAAFMKILGDIFKGGQPTSGQQAQGQQTNQNLGQYLGFFA